MPQDDAEAVRWFRLAAEQGDATAQNNLGVRYGTGRGVPQDDAEAVRWYRLAAEQGHASGYWIGLQLWLGRSSGLAPWRQPSPAIDEPRGHRSPWLRPARRLMCHDCFTYSEDDPPAYPLRLV